MVAVYAETRFAFINTSSTRSSRESRWPSRTTSPSGPAQDRLRRVAGAWQVRAGGDRHPGRSVVRSVPLDKTPRALEFSPDGKYLYFTQAGLSAVAVLDPDGDRIVAQIPVGASPHYANFTRVMENSAGSAGSEPGPGRARGLRHRV